MEINKLQKNFEKNKNKLLKGRATDISKNLEGLFSAQEKLQSAKKETTL